MEQVATFGWLLVVAFIVGLAALFYLVKRSKGKKSVVEVSSTSDARTDPASNSSAITALVVLGIVVMWVVGVLIEYGPQAFLPGWDDVNQGRILLYLSTMSTGSLILSIVPALVLAGIYAIFIRSRDGHVPRNSFRIFLICVFAIQVWWVTGIDSKEQSSGLEEYLAQASNSGQASASTLPVNTTGEVEILVDTPRMISADMRLDRLSRQGVTLIMEMSLLNLSAVDDDMQGFDSMMRSFYLQMICNDPEGRRDLEIGGIARLIMRDRNGENLGQADISIDDCEEKLSRASNTASQWPGVRGTPMMASPEMIEPNVRLEQVFRDDLDMYYVYTRTDVLKHEMDLYTYERSLRGELRDELCNNPAYQSMLSTGGSFVYIYNDRAGDLITKVTVNRESC